MKQILLLEDDPILAMTITKILSQHGKVHHFSTFRDIENQDNYSKYDIAFIDLYHPNDPSDEPSGMHLLRRCQLRNVPAFILSSSPEERLVSQAYQLGAKGFISKNNGVLEIKKCIQYSFIKLSSKLIAKNLFNDYITSSSLLKNSIQQLIDSPELFDLNIHLNGETGSGKTELVKQICHHLFPKKNFVNINLSELSESLIESELFGHVKGAFTGATQDKTGLFQKANGGILFLDEIATIPLYLQNKLLKVIEEKHFKPVGSDQFQQVNFMLISATSDDPQLLIKNNTLKPDFFFRINGLQIQIPSLNQRKKDIPLIASNIINRSSKRIVLSDDVIRDLMNRSWPGNIRQLENHIQNLIAIYPKQMKLHFNPIDDEQCNEDHLEELLQKGLPAMTKEYENKIFTKIAHQCHYKVNEICRTLQISKAMFYRLKQQTGVMINT